MCVCVCVCLSVCGVCVYSRGSVVPSYSEGPRVESQVGPARERTELSAERTEELKTTGGCAAVTKNPGPVARMRGNIVER